MFTLKIASSTTDERRAPIDMLFPGIKAVHVIERLRTLDRDGHRVFARRVAGVGTPDPITCEVPIDSADWCYGDYTDYARNAPAGTDVALIYAVFGEDRADHCYMLVERAWLLGPHGGTIDRIAP